MVSSIQKVLGSIPIFQDFFTLSESLSSHRSLQCDYLIFSSVSLGDGKMAYNERVITVGIGWQVLLAGLVAI